MPVLEPVVATLLANTGEFVASLQAAKQQMSDFKSVSESQGGIAGSSFGSSVTSEGRKAIEQGASDLETAGIESGGKLRKGLTDETDKIEEDITKTGKKTGNAFKSAMTGPVGEITNIFESLGMKLPGVATEFLGVGGAMDEAAVGAGALDTALAPLLAIPVAVIAVVAGLVVAGGAAFEMGSKFQEATNKIAAAEQISTKAASDIGAVFLTTAFNTTYSAEEIANAFAGVAGMLRGMNGAALDASQSMDVMDASMTLAEGTGGSLSSTTSSLVKVMQAYQTSVKSASAVSDVLFQTSVTTGMGISQIASSFQRFHTMLGATTPPLQNMAGLLVDLTAHGESGRGAISALTIMMKALATPTAAAAAAQQEQNVHFQDAKGAMLPFGQVLDQVKPKIEGLGTANAIAELKLLGFGGASAKILGIIQAGSSVYNADVQAVLRHGTAADAAAKATSGLGAQFEKIKSGVMDLVTQIGGYLVPVVTFLARVAMDYLSYILTIVKTYIEYNVIAFRVFKKVVEELIGPIQSLIGIISGGIGSIVSFGASILGLGSSHDKAKESANQHKEALDKINISTQALKDATNITTTALEQQGQKAGVTATQLASLMDIQKQGSEAIVKDLKTQSDAAGTTAEALANAAVSSGTSIDTISKAIQKSSSSAQSAFNSSFDLISTIGKQTTVTGDTISQFYSKSITDATTWTQNVQQAIKDGYDPATISQLITAGPQKAGTILQGLVTDYSPQLVSLMSQSADAMTKEGQIAVEQARLTQEAVSAKSSTMVTDLGTAMGISQQMMAQGASANVQSLATALNMSIPQIQSIASEYGIALPAALYANLPQTQSAANQYGLSLPQALMNNAPGAVAGASAITNAVQSQFQGNLPTTQAIANQYGISLSVALMNNGPGAVAAASALADSTNKSLQSVDATAAGATTAIQYSSGLTSQQAATANSGSKLAAAATTSAAAVDAKPAGNNLVAGIIQGVQVKQNDLNAVTLAAIKSAIHTDVGFVGGQSLGTALDNGIIQGIYNGQQDVANAAVDVLKKAIGSAKVTLKIQSPSKVAADEIGLPFVQGIAQGIAGNSHLATNAVGSLTTGMIQPIGGSVGSSGVSPLSARGGAGGTTLQITIPLEVDGRTLAQIVTQYQLRNGRATGNVLGQYAGGTQTQTATGINATNAVAR